MRKKAAIDFAMKSLLVTDVNELRSFLVEAKKSCYAGDGREATPQRPGFKELDFSRGDWNYRDSYVGFFCAPGQEIVRFHDVPIWAMSYDGGMTDELQGDVDLAKRFVEEELSHHAERYSIVKDKNGYLKFPE